MNYISLIVKLIGKPEQSFFDDNISVTEVMAKFSQVQKNRNDVIVKLCIWGNLAYDMVQYYQINDYIIIEGYVSLTEMELESNDMSNEKSLEISVFKIYPFLLSNTRLNRESE
jgi:hypothetical protein